MAKTSESSPKFKEVSSKLKSALDEFEAILDDAGNSTDKEDARRRQKMLAEIKKLLEKLD